MFSPLRFLFTHGNFSYLINCGHGCVGVHVICALVSVFLGSFYSFLRCGAFWSSIFTYFYFAPLFFVYDVVSRLQYAGCGIFLCCLVGGSCVLGVPGSRGGMLRFLLYCLRLLMRLYITFRWISGSFVMVPYVIPSIWPHVSLQVRIFRINFPCPDICSCVSSVGMLLSLRAILLGVRCDLLVAAVLYFDACSLFVHVLG